MEYDFFPTDNYDLLFLNQRNLRRKYDVCHQESR
jgi:hypothetical protein